MSRRILALFAIAVLLLAGCSDGDADTATGDTDTGADDDSGGDESSGAADVEAPTPDVSDTDDNAMAEDMADSGSDGEAGEGDDTGAGFAPTQDSADEPGERMPAEVTALFVGRQIIKTGEVVVEAADVAATTDELVDVVFDNGGAIWGQETESEPAPSAVLTIRVPPADFDRLLSAITDVPGVGLVSERTTSDDVTEVVVDLDARITAAQSSVARVQVLLDAASDLNTIFQLEEELAARQADLERLLGQRKTIGDQVALSTITLTILELDPDRLEPAMDVIAWLGDDTDDACPGASNLSIGADDTAVLCLNISNTGEDDLTAVDVQLPTLRLRVDDFLAQDGVVQDGTASLDRIPAGEELLLTVELDAEDGAINRVDVSGGVDLRVDVTATPATSETVELDATDTVFISADVDDPLPGFADAFSKGWGAMLTVVGILMIVVGALLPFVPVILLALWLGRRVVWGPRARGRSLDQAPVGTQVE
ncbi:MAG: DUF4349 domain-containing protein [Acidimicrobiales bacterium]